MPKENLVLYAEFTGLDAHAEAWKKTAAYKMLNQTPLGVMLEEVAAQLLDKGMSFLPSRKLSGTDMVTLVKSVARNGWVFALMPVAIKSASHDHPDASGCQRQRDRKLTSGLLGDDDGPNAKPKPDHKAGRTLVLVPISLPESGWAWWAEKNDLVICMPQTGADADPERARRQGSLRGRPSASQGPVPAGGNFPAAHAGLPRSLRAAVQCRMRGFESPRRAGFVDGCQGAGLSLGVR